MPTNKFHYIWMGSVLPKYENAFKDGPNDLARQLRELINYSNTENTSSPRSNPQDKEIVMWVPEDIIDDIRERKLLDPLITIKPVESLYQNSKNLSRDELDKLKRSVDVLGNHKAYSAQKDVLSAAIIEEYGGYYFDTTTQIESLSYLIDNQPKEIWFPRIIARSKYPDGTHYEYQGEISYCTSYAKQGKTTTINARVSLPDVWTLHYDSPGEGFFRAMMNSYTLKCQYFFPEAFNNQHISEITYTTQFKGQTIHKSGYVLGVEGSGEEIMLNYDRDKLIGELVIYSLLDAVSLNYGEPSDEIMQKISSPATEVDGHKVIASMGIKKTHNGMWRQAELETRMDNSISTSPMSEPIEQNEVNSENAKDRTHMLAVNAGAFKDIKIKYQQMKGDALKREIIADFRKQIAEIDSIEALDLFVKDFKNSVSYSVLKTGQDVVSRLGARGTGSVKTINAIVLEKSQELEQAKHSNDMNR